MSEYLFGMLLLSCIIRNALHWVQSPLARRGDFSLVVYVVGFLLRLLRVPRLIPS
jgi:hypothetical protein